MPMDRKDQDKIRAHMDYIIDNFDVTDILTELVGKGLTLKTKDEIDQVDVIRDKNRKCLECLMKSENGSYDELIKELRSKNYTKVIDRLESGLPPEAGKPEVAIPSIHVPENKRHLHLEEKHLMHFSECVSPKDKIQWATCLGISKLDVEHIDMNYSDSGTQMMEILFCWRAEPGRNPTLGLLMDQFNQSLENGINIDKVKVEKIILEET